MRTKNILTVFLLLAITTSSFAYKEKRIFGFFGSWNAWKANTVQWDKITDVVYAFILPNRDGSVRYDNVGTSSASFNSGLNTVVALAKANNVKVHISFGGWSATHDGGSLTSPDPISDMAENDVAREKFIDIMMDYVIDYDLDGINADWEYPAISDAYYLEELIYGLRSRLRKLGKERNRKYWLTGAVAASTFGSEAYNGSIISDLDFVFNMAFDDQSTNHSSVSFGKASINYWINNKGALPEQMVLGIPFYTSLAQGGSSYSWFSNSNPAAYFNSADGSYGGRNYNSRPMIEEKIDYVLEKGGSGVFIWEITQDRSDEYSLLNVIADKFYPNGDVSVKEEAGSQNYGVYPSLITDHFFINISDNSIKSLNYQLIDITGKLVHSGQINQTSKIQLSSDLKSGIYILNLTTGSERKTVKLVHK